MSYPKMNEASGPLDYEAAAQASIRAYCGWHIAPVLTETVTVTTRHISRDLRLPTLKLLEVLSVETLDDWQTGRQQWRARDEHEYEWDTDGLLRLTTGGHWPRALQGVRVTIRHGYEPDEVPDVLALADAIEKRARMNLGGVASQSVNGASVSYQTAGGAPLSVPLLQIEKQALAAYTLGLGRIGG